MTTDAEVRRDELLRTICAPDLQNRTIMRGILRHQETEEGADASSSFVKSHFTRVLRRLANSSSLELGIWFSGRVVQHSVEGCSTSSSIFRLLHR